MANEHNLNIITMQHASGPISIEVIYWKGQARYKCPLNWESGGKCEYDSYDPDQLFDHMKLSHTFTGKGLTQQQATEFQMKPNDVAEFKDLKFADDSEEPKKE